MQDESLQDLTSALHHSLMQGVLCRFDMPGCTPGNGY